MERAEAPLGAALILHKQDSWNRGHENGMAVQQAPEAALDPVSDHGASGGTGHNHPEPARIPGFGEIIKIHGPQAQTNAFFENKFEIAPSLKPRCPFQQAAALDGEPLSPLGPAAGQYLAAARRFHPGSESVNLFALPVVGLERAFHGKTSLIPIKWPLRIPENPFGIKGGALRAGFSKGFPFVPHSPYG
jgi:hypothetical protein